MTINNDIEKRLWAAADQLWANSSLKPGEFSTPVLGLIFLRYAKPEIRKSPSPLAPTSILRAKCAFPSTLGLTG